MDCTFDEDADLNTLADYRSRRRIIIALWTETVGADGYSNWSADPDSAIWEIVGAPTGGLPNVGGGKLSDFAAAFPNACIVDGISGDGGLARDVSTDAGCDTGASLPSTAPGRCGKATSGILLVLGGSTTLTATTWSFRSLRVNDTVYR